MTNEEIYEKVCDMPSSASSGNAICNGIDLARSDERRFVRKFLKQRGELRVLAMLTREWSHKSKQDAHMKEFEDEDS